MVQVPTITLNCKASDFFLPLLGTFTVTPSRSLAILNLWPIGSTTYLFVTRTHCQHCCVRFTISEHSLTPSLWLIFTGLRTKWLINCPKKLRSWPGVCGTSQNTLMDRSTDIIIGLLSRRLLLILMFSFSATCREILFYLPLFIYSACIILHIYFGSVGCSKLCTELTRGLFMSYTVYVMFSGMVTVYSLFWKLNWFWFCICFGQNSSFLYYSHM